MRALLLSDTHAYHNQIPIPIKGYSMVIHTGDFTNTGSEQELDSFLLWYSKIPCTYKILIAGNHDLSLEPTIQNPNAYADFKKRCEAYDIIYLYANSINIDGIRFTGFPHVPQFYDWAFMHSEKDLKEIFTHIPASTDVLLTHGPALWHGDEVPVGHVGSEALLDRIKEIKSNKNSPLKYHIFGHIHEEAGYDKTDKALGVRFINASSFDYYGNMSKPKIINIKKQEQN